MLAVQLKLSGFVTADSGSLKANSRYGQADVPAGDFVIRDAPNLSHQVYQASPVLTPGKVFLIDLLGGSGERDILNLPFKVSAVNLVEILIKPDPKAIKANPTTAKVSILLGPQGQSNAAQLWFGGIGPTDRVEIAEQFRLGDSRDGWPVSPGSHVLALLNNGALPVTPFIRIVGRV